MRLKSENISLEEIDTQLLKKINVMRDQLHNLDIHGNLDSNVKGVSRKLNECLNVFRTRLDKNDIDDILFSKKFINGLDIFQDKLSKIYENKSEMSISECKNLLNDISQYITNCMNELDIYISSRENLKNDLLAEIEKIKSMSSLIIKNKTTIEKLTEELKKNQLINDAHRQDIEIYKNEINNIIGEKKELTEKLYILENKQIEKHYFDASVGYRTKEKNYRNLFLISIFTLLIVTTLITIFHLDIINLLYVESDSINVNIEFWVIKISTMLIGITLISYFLKQSSHYQKLADQSHQTQLEIDAFPSFMNSVPPNETIEIRKELALKYFGKELDSSPHKDMSNIISEQMKNTNEMVKATTDAIKNLKGSD